MPNVERLHFPEIWGLDNRPGPEVSLKNILDVFKFVTLDRILKKKQLTCRAKEDLVTVATSCGR